MANHFVITIARGYGSGGKTIGKMLSEALGIPFYDRELFYMASEESGINLEMFGNLDEKVRKSFLDKRTHKYVGDLIPPESSSFVSDENLFNYQAKIIKDLADKESCIIVGRCADFVLKDRDNVVKPLFGRRWRIALKPLWICNRSAKKTRNGKSRRLTATAVTIITITPAATGMIAEIMTFA